jgi:hypothetical protein
MAGISMTRAKVVQEKIMEDNKAFLALFVETRNANLLLLSEGEDQLGTLAVALPQARKLIGPPLSSILLGDRNTMIARILAERLSQRTKKLALVSVFTKTVSEREAGPIFLKLIEKTASIESRESESTTSPLSD